MNSSYEMKRAVAAAVAAYDRSVAEFGDGAIVVEGPIKRDAMQVAIETALLFLQPQEAAS